MTSVFYIIISISFVSLGIAVYFLLPVLNERVKEDLIKQTDANSEIAKLPVDDFVRKSEFQEIKNDFKQLIAELETNNKISTLQAKDLQQVKIQISDIERKVADEHNSIALIDDKVNATLHIAYNLMNRHDIPHMTTYSFLPQTDVYERDNNLVEWHYGLSTLKLASAQNPKLGQNIKRKSTASQKK